MRKWFCGRCKADKLPERRNTAQSVSFGGLALKGISTPPWDLLVAIGSSCMNVGRLGLVLWAAAFKSLRFVPVRIY
jgi:hypothetical protein